MLKASLYFFMAVGFVETLEISLSYSDLDCSFSTSTFSPSRCNKKLLRSTYCAFETTAVLFTFNALCHSCGRALHVEAKK